LPLGSQPLLPCGTLRDRCPRRASAQL